jgi:L-asparagine transporter-like permease
MDAQAPEDEAARGRDETPDERADRNWGDLLQELRVMQTGVQLLTAFLLALPFQQRFTELDDRQADVFVVVVLLSATATGLLVAPVSMHRLLFRQRRKDDLVRWAHRLAIAGLAALGTAVAGVVWLVMSMVEGTTVATGIGAAVLAGLLLLWLVLPLAVRRQRSADEHPRRA